MLPVVSESAPFCFQRATSGREFSSSCGPEASTARNWPLRSRSACTMAEIFCGAPASPRNGAMAVGNWVRPTPVISTRNCAKAGKEAAEARGHDGVAARGVRQGRGERMGWAV